MEINANAIVMAEKALQDFVDIVPILIEMYFLETEQQDIIKIKRDIINRFQNNNKSVQILWIYY